MAEKTNLENTDNFERNEENALTEIDAAETSDDATDEATDETEQIREQIEETRNRLGDTIDAIQEKLSLANISEQVTEQVTEQVSNIYETAKDSVYEATIVKAGKFMSKFNRELQKSDIINKVSENPLPVLLITVGAGLLFFKGKKKKSFRYQNQHPANSNVNRRSGNQSSVLGDARETLTGAASSAYETAGSAASSAYETAGNAASSAYETAGNAANSAYQSVSGAASGTVRKIGDLGGQARDSYDYYIEENPLAVGAVAFAVGAVLGLSIPSTQYENQFAGQAREQLISKVKDTVGETVDKVKNIAEQAKNTVGEEAKNQGLV